MTTEPNIFSALPVGYSLDGRFTIDSVLALGGFSIIYRVFDSQTQEMLVLKECAPEGYVFRDSELCICPLNEHAADIYQKALENSIHEAQILMDLTQRGVQGITGFVTEFQAHQSHYIAMRQAVGNDLHAWANFYRESKTPFPLDFLLPILTQVLDILQNVHDAGYFHCDVKPANIIVDEHANVCLIDFGAVRTKKIQNTGTVAISPGFSPPEFYPGQIGQIGAWTDMYMLASLLYNIISNRVPDSADKRVIVDRNPRISVDKRLVKIYPSLLLSSIDKALSIEAKDRFYSATLWKEYYQNYANSSKVTRAKKVAKAHSFNAQDLLIAGMSKKKHNKNLLRDAGHRSASKAGQPPAKSSSAMIWVVLLILAGAALYFGM